MFEVSMHTSEDDDRFSTKEGEGSLEEALSFARFTVENASISIFQISKDRRIIDVNTRACLSHGYSREELLGMDLLELDTGLTPDKWIEHRKLVGLDGSRTFESVHRRKDGSRFPVEVSYTLFDSKEKNIIVSFVHDITERKRADLALEEAEEWFRAMFENIVIGVYQITPDGRVLNANPALARMLGYESTYELMKNNLNSENLGPDYLRSDFKSKIENEGQVVGLESPWTRSDGSIVWIRESARAIMDDAGNVMYYEGTAEDITYRIEIEEALRKSEEQYRLFFEEDVTSVLLTLPDGTISACNPAFVKTFGFESRREAMSARIGELYPDENVFLRLVDLVREQKTVVDYELELRKRDGSPAYVRANFVGIFDEGDELVEIKQYIINETERKSLEQQLIQAQKLEGIGRLAGGVAHDYNNILCVILGHGELLLSRFRKEDPVYHQVEAIISAANRGAELTKRLLAFARKEIVSPKVVNMNMCIESINKMLQRLIGENIRLLFVPGADLWNIHIDPTQLDQVLINLASNARDAIVDIGTITIETSNVTIEDHYTHDHMDFRADDYVQLIFTDNGRGMDRETKEKIFEPFFTTKPKGQGTGLGLSTVYGIVKQNGGNLNVYSEPGRGTTFRIYFPRYFGEVREFEPKQPQEPLSGSGTVMVVEDQPDLLNLAKDTLEDFGYRVITALSPSEAILLFGMFREEIDLVLTDVIMPIMNGNELRSRIEKVKPDIKTLFMSGYTANVITDGGMLNEGIEFIQKPFTPKTLAKKVRDVLNSK